MDSKNIFLTLIIIIIFACLYLFNVLIIGIKNIKKNWPEYRCNPMVMPFAGIFGHDIVTNFNYCIKNIQSVNMGEFLQPLNYSQNVLGSVVGELNDSVQSIRAFFDKIRNFISEIVNSIMGVFLNILVSFQFLIISILDTFAKMIGIVVVMASVISGSNKFSSSVWKGPPGKTVRSIGSVCFDENTLIKKQNNSIVKMKDLNLGDVLKNNSVVKAKMYISNLQDNKHIDNLYTINGGENSENIIVSGSHLIFDKKKMNFIQVKDFSEAKICDYNLDNLFCLITSDHTIPLGNYIFHDWEDNNGSKSKDI